MVRLIPCRTASRQRRSSNLHTFYGLAAMLLALLLQLLHAAFFVPAVVAAPSTPPIVAAPSAIVVDFSTARVLYSKDPNRRTPMASTTKIMTALTAISIPGTNPDEKYTVQKEDLVGEASMNLNAGDVVTFQDLLYGMLINSGNDAAMAIARYAGSKLPGTDPPITKFVAQMNQKAVELGMRNSHYANPHGLDAVGHYSSAFDLAISGWYLLKQPLLSKIVATPSIVKAGKQLRNLNNFLGRYQGANGIKPGQTDAAGLCLVASATRNNQTIITVVLNEEGANGYNSDPVLLSDYGFNTLKDGTLASAQGGTGTTADYLGKVTGDKLLVEGAGIAATNPLQVVSGNYSAPKDIISAQIISDTPAPTPAITPGQQTSGTPGNGNNNNNEKKDSGGVNFFLIIIILLLVLLALWFVARMGFIRGDKGRDIAFMVEDGVVAAGRGTMRFLKKLWTQVKPGHPDDAKPEVDTPPAVPARENRLQGNNYRSRIEPTRNTPPAARPTSQPPTTPASRPDYTNRAPYTPGTSAPRNSASDYVYTENPFSSQRPKNPRPAEENNFVEEVSTSSRANPLDNFFDDIPAFQVNPADEPGGNSGLRPPNPLPSRPAINTVQHQNRTAAEPQQKPSESYEPPVLRKIGADITPNSVESLTMRARQAIDYSYAGRLQASTDEFRKVVEQNHLFDFSTIDEFEQMPVLGFKALANAYHQVGRTRASVFLLDMAIEKYPNDLELRNLHRSFKREIGA